MAAKQVKWGVIKECEFDLFCRTVLKDQRSVAVSLQFIVLRCLGGIPGPIILGSLIDHSCIFWKQDCSQNVGACLMYDNAMMSNVFIAAAAATKALTIVFFFLALICYKPPPQPVIEVNVSRSYLPKTNSLMLR